jgi:hypothetical protein
LMAEDPEQPADDFGQYLIATPYRGRASRLPWLALPEERSGGGVVSHPFPSGPRGGSVAIGTSANVSEIAKLEAQIAVLLDERLANLATIKALKIEAERRDTAFASSNSPRWTEMSRALGSHGSGKGEGRSVSGVPQHSTMMSPHKFEVFAVEMHGHLCCVMDLIGMEACPASGSASLCCLVARF